MLALIQLFLLGVLACQLQGRIGLLKTFKGLPGYLCSLGLTLFLANWINFLLYVLLGWGAAQQLLSWLALLAAIAGLHFARKLREIDERPVAPIQSALSFRRLDSWFLFLAGFILLRFYTGLDVDHEGNVWSNFNFVDTAFHLSVANAFLASSFPPMDLDLAPYPLKYHFLADFHLAHFMQLGLSGLKALWMMNLVSAAVMVGTLWSVFESWLRLPSRWVMLAVLLFLCLNPALLNLLHYLALKPAFFHLDTPFHGLVRFPYFNFEFSLTNLIEPQRGLLFSLPIALLVLHGIFGEFADPSSSAPVSGSQTRTLQCFWLICLLPLSHIVAFAVLALSLVPTLWRNRGWFFARWWWWLPVFGLGVAQLLYLQVYGPPTNASYSGWDVASVLPLGDFAAFPAWTRRLVFWFFVDGDFLFWGLFFAGLALRPGVAHQAAMTPARRLREFLHRWRWYFAVCGFFFAVINVYRYSFAWGDSNKFILFCNLGLSLVIVLGAAQWTGPRRILSAALWCFFFLLCTLPAAYEAYLDLVVSPHGRILMFHRNVRAAGAWLKTNAPPLSVVLTSAYNDIHFVTPLAGLPTLAGIYGDSNPYRQDERGAEIRRIYEEGDLAGIRKLGAKYVCVSGYERLRYTLHPRWTELMNSGGAVIFHAGGGPEDHDSVYIFDPAKLAP